MSTTTKRLVSLSLLLVSVALCTGCPARGTSVEPRAPEASSAP